MTGVTDPSRFLQALMDAALDAARPEHMLGDWLPERPTGRTIVLGAGKAAASMARAVEAAWPGPLEGLVVTRYGHAAATRHVEVVEAAHPVPDEAGRDAALRILELARGAGPDDLVLCLMSGGASALLTCPADGLTLEDKQRVNEALLRSGAPIGEMNRVRKRLSAIKGGRLGAAIAPARCVSLLISDVPGDDPAVIGSGPTVADPREPDDAEDIVRRRNIELPAHVASVLRENRPIRTLDDNQSVHVVATPQRSLEAAAARASTLGVRSLILGDAIEGEAREAAQVFAGIARQVVEHDQPLPRPCVLLSGGETTVTVRGKGRGGRNAEFMLGLAIALQGRPGVHAIACDTDGIDGSQDNAGARADPSILARGARLGLDAREYLERNDAYSYFERTGDLVMTGPTLTNVNDFRAIYIE